MNRHVRLFCFVVPTLIALGGCSSQPTQQAAQTVAAPDKIQGKAQVLEESNGASDAALNAGGASSVYLWVGTQRYRLFLRKPADVVHGNEYIAEGIYAQKAIDEIGDPDLGKHGYPLDASCHAVVNKIWPGLAMDEADTDATSLRSTVQRHPARPVFLVTKLTAVTADSGTADRKKEADAKIPQVTVPADKQKALLIEGPTQFKAPLWEPDGGTVKCPVVIGADGKISDVETGKQLCESVPWDKFSYKPTMQGGHPVKVETDVEVKFDPLK
jgi:hypothetical protein